MTRDLAAVAAPLRTGHDPLVPPGMVDLPDTGPGFSAGLIARDRNDHTMLLIEE